MKLAGGPLRGDNPQQSWLMQQSPLSKPSRPARVAPLAKMPGRPSTPATPVASGGGGGGHRLSSLSATCPAGLGGPRPRSSAGSMGPSLRVANDGRPGTSGSGAGTRMSRSGQAVLSESRLRQLPVPESGAGAAPAGAAGFHTTAPASAWTAPLTPKSPLTPKPPHTPKSPLKPPSSPAASDTSAGGGVAAVVAAATAAAAAAAAAAQQQQQQNRMARSNSDGGLGGRSRQPQRHMRHSMTFNDPTPAVSSTAAPRESRALKAMRQSVLMANRRRSQGLDWGTSSLQEISTVANSVSYGLDKMIERVDLAYNSYSEDVTTLRRISNTSRAVNEDLEKLTSNKFKRPVSAASSAKAGPVYDDPLLSKARTIARLTKQLCEELDMSSGTLGQEAAESAEAAALQEISATTRRVCEDMVQLQGTSWAMQVLSMRPGDMQAFADQDGHSELSEDPPGTSMPRQLSTKLDAQKGDPRGLFAGVLDMQDLPALQEILAQQASDEISEAELQRMQTAFKRFKVPDSNDLHISDITGMLLYLGHVLADESIVMPILKELTAYDYLDFEEFVAFMGRYKPKEREHFQVVFEKYDKDQSGGISISEIKDMLIDLGFIPLQKMVKQALALADTGGVGQLDYSGFVTFLAAYRRFEGFCQEEVEEIHKVFNRHSGGGDAAPSSLLPADQLRDALVQVFGVHVSPFAAQLEEQLRGGGGGTGAGLHHRPGRADSLNFAEFLVFCRKTREASLARLKGDFPDLADRKGVFGPPEGTDQKRVTFSIVDTDGSGGISESELRVVLKGMGYTPLRQDLIEILTEVDKSIDEELDFSEFFDFMLIFRQREGFGQAVVEEMRRVYDRFDADRSGEISAMELAELFRELGYKATMEEIHVFVMQVDANGSMQLDFREFLQLMRLHREQELQHILAVFEQCKDKVRNVIPGPGVQAALESLGHYDVQLATRLDRKRDADFDRLVTLADMCRAARVAREKKKAGFSDHKIEIFREFFEKFDKDRSGELETAELPGLLAEFDWEPKSREEQAALMQKIDLARLRAREAGIDGVSKDGSSAINFWTFVQLSRILVTEHDQAEEENVQRLVEELHFTQKEVEEFRLIFHEKKKALAADRTAAAGRGDHEEEGLEHETGKDAKGLPKQAVRKLIAMVGVDLKGDRKAALEDRLTALGCTETSTMEFPGFLRLMRWLMDSGWLPE